MLEGVEELDGAGGGVIVPVCDTDEEGDIDSDCVAVRDSDVFVSDADWENNFE